MTRAALYRKWTDARLARELAKAARRAAVLADEANRRARELEKAERREYERTKAPDHETSFNLAHRAEAGRG